MARLLVIDDSLTVRKVVELSFRSTSWRVDFAASGAEGVAAAARVRPDLILLDYVLPDMKATDVCQRLAQDGRSADIPVLVMSGNLEKVRHLFHVGRDSASAGPSHVGRDSASAGPSHVGRDSASAGPSKDLGAVVDFIAKPFTPQDLVARVNAALGARSSARAPAPAARKSTPPGRRRSSRAPEAASVALSFHQKEAGAKALFARLRSSFAQIPEWTAQLDGAPPAQFFARKILTPDLMTELLQALVPIYREILGASPDAGKSVPAEAAGAEGEVAFAGRLSSWPVQDLLRILDASGRTGEFRIHSGNLTTILHVRHGEIVLATCLDPVDYVRESPLDLSGVSPAAMAQAEAEQRATGKPLFVELVDAGALPPCDLIALLCEQGKRLLLRATEQTSGRFAWEERAAPPAYVEIYGRRISLAQIPLERLRRERPLRQAEQAIPSMEVVFERTDGFTRKLRRLDLTSPERLVLALVDRRNTVQDIVDRSGLAARETMLILHRLSKVDLVRGRGLASSPGARVQARPIMILEPDVEGFQRPLADLLRARAAPIELIPLNDDPDPLAAIVRARPSLVILNASAADRSAEKIARGIRAAPEISDLPLVAVLNIPRSQEADQLSAAGFDVVLSKPVSYADIERLLVA